MNEETPQALPVKDFINSFESADYDLSQVRTAASKLGKTSFRRKLKGYTEREKRNSHLHFKLRALELHPGAYESMNRPDGIDPRKFYPDNLAIRQATVGRIVEYTGYVFEAVESVPGIFQVDWLDKDEVVVREDDLFRTDKDLEPGHTFDISESRYTIYKGGKLQGRLSFAELKDKEVGKEARTATKVSEKPFNLTTSVDGINSQGKNLFIYLSPKSDYLK